MRRVVAGAFATGIVLGLLWGATGRVLNDGPSICPLLAATGIPCPFCGMTRATVAIGAGDFSRALALHPLAPVVLAGVFAMVFSIAIGRERWLRANAPLVLASIAVVWAVKLVA